jgi:hypothetical protein
VMMVNDLYQAEPGELSLTLEDASGREVARASRPFELAPLGTLTRDLDLAVPAEPGSYLLKATAVTVAGSRTVSRRKVVIPKGAEQPRAEARPALRILRGRPDRSPSG